MSPLNNKEIKYIQKILKRSPNFAPFIIEIFI